MSREVRMVPANWEHPREHNAYRGEMVYKPLLDRDFASEVEEWENVDLPEWIEGKRLWDEEGKVKMYGGELKTIEEVVAEALASRPYAPPPANPTYQWWAGEKPERPNESDYMPSWPAHERTHCMMYESTSEGTPLSPAFATPEELAKWLVDNKASAFAGETASYEAWLRIARGGYAPSAVSINGGGLMSGVEALKDDRI